MASNKKRPDLADIGTGPSKQYSLEDLLQEFSANKEQSMEPGAISANPPARKPPPEIMDVPRADLKPAQVTDMDEMVFESILPKKTSLSQPPPMEAMKVGNSFSVGGDVAPQADLTASLMPKSEKEAKKVIEAQKIAQENPDKFQSMFSKQAEELTKRLASAEQKLQEGETLTEKEKLARGLLAVLPALLGGGLGAAISGGVGGDALVGLAQGLGGGAQGGAQAIGMMEAEKAEKRQQARADIKDIRAAKSLLDQQIMGREGVLEERGIRAKEKGEEMALKKGIAEQELSTKKELAEADRQFKAQEAAEKRKFDEAKYRADNATTLEGKRMWADAMRSQSDQIRDLKKEQLQIQWQKLQQDAEAKAAKKDEKNAAFTANTDVARNLLGQLKEVINRSGTYETRFGNEADSAVLDAVPYQLAITYAKIVDPSSVAREGEVAAAQKYLIKLGPTADKKVALQQIKHFEDTIEAYTKAFKSGKNPVEEKADENKSAAPYGDIVERGGKKYQWDQATGKYYLIK